MGTVRFELRTEKKNGQGKAPVRMIYQVKGDRKYYSTEKTLFPENWNAETQQAVYLDKKQAKKLLPGVDYDLLPTDKEVKDINRDLARLADDVRAIELRYELDKFVYTADMVIERLKQDKKPAAKKEASPNELIAFVDQYLRDHANTRKKGSLTVYRTMKSHLLGYQQTTKRKVTFENIDYAFFQSFQNYLLSPRYDAKGKEVRPLNNITIAKQLSTIKTFLNYARTQGITVSDKYSSFKIKRENDLEVIALTNEEFERLFTMDLSARPALAQVRDVFCFSCATGLRYSDLAQLKREHIKTDTIDLTTIKTTDKAKIPLNPYSRAILDKYKGKLRPLPIISNQKSNEHLKELCKLAEIDEPIEIVRKRGAERIVELSPKWELMSMHAGRKTFVTLSLDRGMSAEQVMSISGHRDYKSFKRYVNITEERKKAAMQAAWGDISKTKLKAV